MHRQFFWKCPCREATRRAENSAGVEVVAVVEVEVVAEAVVQSQQHCQYHCLLFLL